MLHYESLVEPGKHNSKCDDVVGIMEYADGLVAVLADGATGHGFGLKAAQAVVNRMLDLRPNAVDREHALEGQFYMADMDVAQIPDECDASAVVAIVRDNTVYGCSAGDTEAWLFPFAQGFPVKLTERQYLKPRVGSGARPVLFNPTRLGGGVLLLASDGLFNWLLTSTIRILLANSDRRSIPRALRDSVVRANGGYLPDDFSVVVIWDEEPGAAVLAQPKTGSQHSESVRLIPEYAADAA